ncbi:MAG TPA: hypothetical protein ENN87_01520 [Phycisphaerales bacterium]|nr:hypothetical protein [Phycisphaerales bacterium]
MQVQRRLTMHSVGIAHPTATACCFWWEEPGHVTISIAVPIYLSGFKPCDVSTAVNFSTEDRESMGILFPQWSLPFLYGVMVGRKTGELG